MSRKQRDDDGSLELLLDTICNTFGGVLFISILVVLLLNVTSEEAAETPPNDTVQSQLVEAQARLHQTNSELERLMTAVKSQGEIADQIVDLELSGLVRTLTRAQQGIVEQTERKVRGIEQITENQIDINENTQKIAVHQQELQEQQRKLAALEQNLEDEIEARTQAAKLPKSSATQKDQMPMFLKAGRLCTLVKQVNNNLVRNNAETVVKQDAETGPHIEPKPGAGVKILLDGDNPGLVARLNHFAPDKHYLKVFVWPDSFPHFAMMKDHLVAKRFEYLLVPFTGEQKISVGAETNQEETQ